MKRLQGFAISTMPTPLQTFASPSTTAQALPALHADELFEAWAAFKAQQSKRSLGQESAVKYRAIWSAWLQYLASQKLDWRRVDAATLTGFVHAMRARSRRQPASSTVSRTRYWRAVSGIYGFMTQHEAALQTVAPNSALHEASPPPDARSDAADSAVLSDAHWNALLTAQPLGVDWTAARDLAMLHLVMETGASVQELRCIQLQDLSFAPLPCVRIKGAREAQRRLLPIGESALPALREWLTIREAMTTTATELFVSRKGMQAPSAMAIWHNLNQLITQALHACGDRHYHHAGPNVLRNAVLLRWMRAEMPVLELTRRAGLSHPRKLLRIAEQAGEDHVRRIKAASKLLPTAVVA